MAEEINSPDRGDSLGQGMPAPVNSTSSSSTPWEQLNASSENIPDKDDVDLSLTDEDEFYKEALPFLKDYKGFLHSPEHYELGQLFEDMANTLAHSDGGVRVKQARPSDEMSGEDKGTTLIIAAIGLLALALAPLVSILAPILLKILDIIQLVVQTLGPAIGYAIQRIADAIVILAPYLGQFLVFIGKAIQEVADGVVTMLFPAIRDGLNAITTAFKEIVEKFLVPLLSDIAAAFHIVLGILQAVAPGLTAALKALISLFSNEVIGLFRTVLRGLTSIIGGLVKFFNGNIIGLFVKIVDSVGVIAQAITGVILQALQVISNILGAVGAGITSVINGITKVVNALSGEFVNTIRSIGTTLQDFFGVMKTLSSAASEILTAIKTSILLVLNSINDIILGVQFGIAQVKDAIIMVLPGVDESAKTQARQESKMEFKDFKAQKMAEAQALGGSTTNNVQQNVINQSLSPFGNDSMLLMMGGY